MTEIALAYSSIDKARAEAIARVLGALGYKVSPQPLTANAVDEAKALIVFWSSGSVNSIPINQFAAQASANRKLVSVRAGAADPPAAYALVALHDLSRWTGALEAPELRTFLQHVMRMAPVQPVQQPQRAPVAVGASSANPFPFAGPMAAAAAPAQRAEPPPVLRAVPDGPPPLDGPRRKVALQQDDRPPQRAPERAPLRVAERPAERPAPRRATERRRAAGGGVARIAVGAIAVSVIAGAAVAAFHYDSGQQRTASATPNAGGANIAVTPNTLAPPGPTPGAVTDAGPEGAPAGVQVASAQPLPAPLATPDTATVTAATVQSARGWTATLPTVPGAVPGAVKTTPASATAPRAARAPVKLTPIDAAPASVGIVAVDNANLGSGDGANRLQDNTGRPRSPEEERAWIRKQTTYGPDN